MNTTENNAFTVNITGYDSSTTWEVERITNNHWPTMQGNDVLVSLDYAPPYVKIRASNECGYSAWLQYYVEVIDFCGSRGTGIYVVHPNPAKEILTVEKRGLSVEQNSKRKMQSDSYKLYSFEGKPVLESNLSNRMDIYISELPKGRYILKIPMGKNEEIHQIVIEK